MQREVCWERESVSRVLQTEALAGNDAVFLATHFPVEGFDVGGSRAAEISTPTESSVLGALSDPSQRHVFCVVRGEPGSGKSHLIRWLDIQWKRKRQQDVVVLIQRADGSLESTLQQLRKVLPDDGDSLWTGIGAGGSFNFAGKAALFLAALAQSTEPGFLDEERDDVEWCSRWQIGELLRLAEVRQSWAAPANILQLVSGGGGQRNSEMAQFRIDHLRELARLAESSETRKKVHIPFLRSLADEFMAVDEAGGNAAYTETIAPQTARLLRCLNVRLNAAIQFFLGITPDGLRELFRRVRRKLHAQNQRLVLLLEDITSFQGVDNQLVDVLVTDSQTRPDECDLISVVGVTPSYFNEFIVRRGNVLARVTHDIRLGKADGGFENVTALESPEAQVRFSARYLNAVRIGPDRLQEGWETANACSRCPVEQDCKGSFGESDGYSLYPLTRTYITRNFERLKDPAGRLTHKTPRGLLQNLLHPALFHVDDLKSGSYPPAEFPVGAIERARIVAGPVQDRLRATVRDNQSEFDRLILLVGLWGDGSETTATVLNGGQPHFAGVSRAVFETFDAPWPGGDAVEIPAPQPVIAVNPAPVRPQPQRTSTTTAPPQGTGTPRTTAGGIRTGGGGGTSPPRRDLQQLCQDIGDWESGKPLNNPTDWNKELYRAISELNWDQLGVPYFLRQTLFTEGLVQFAGTGGVREQHFVVQPGRWVYRGLRGLLYLRLAPEQQPELNARYVARFRRQLQKQVLAHVHRRMRVFGLIDGTSWNPAHTAVQMLATRAWLRGDTVPLASPHQQWRAVFHDEANVETAPRQRVETWGEILNETASTRPKTKALLLNWTRLSQGSTPGADLFDAAVGARALRQLHSKVALTAVPDATPQSAGDQFSEVTRLLEKALKVRTKLDGLPEREAVRLQRLAKELLGFLREHSIPAHLDRLDKVVTAVSQQLPSAAPGAVAEWKQQLARVKTAGYTTAEESRKTEDFLVSSDDAPRQPAELLQWCLNAPLQDLFNLHLACRSGEEVIDLLEMAVSAYIKEHESAGTATVESVHKTGRRLARAVAAIEEEIDDER